LRQPHLSRIGAVDLADLAAICLSQGRDGLPFPLFATPLRTTEAAGFSAPDGIATGDMGAIWKWADAWTRADIWLECRVGHTDRTIADTRIVACRTGELGYLGIQRPEEPIVDAYTLSAYELGSAVAHSVGLTKPGKRSQITVPGYDGRIPGSSRPLPGSADAHDEDDAHYSKSVLSSGRVARRSSTAAIVDADVTATGVVQSRCKPARSWGIDWTAALVTWVQIADDGDYLYTREQTHATPAGPDDLSARIDRLIAADIAALRNARGLT